jgi:hypothetical protein
MFATTTLLTFPTSLRLVAIFEAEPTGEWKLAQFLGSTLPSDADFGSSIAVGGGQVLVGAPRAFAPNGTQSGAIFVYEKNNQSGTWLNVSTIAPFGSNSSQYGRTMRLTDGTLVVRQNNSTVPWASWILFEKDAQGQWQSASSPTPLDKYPVNVAVGLDASSIAKSGDLLAIGGSAGPGFPGQPNGRVYIFERNAFGTWIQIDRIERDDHVGFGGFGSSIEIVGDRIFVSAPSSQFTAPNGYGSVHVYDRGPGNDWSESAVLLPPNPAGPTSFGQRIAVDGGSLYAYWGNGALEFIETSPGSWTAVSQVVASTGAPGAISSNVLRIVGGRAFFISNAVPNGQGGVGASIPGAVVIHDFAPLSTPISSVSAAVGGSQPLTLRMGNLWSGTPYFMLGSLSGTAPGMLVDLGFASATLPLNFDAYTMLCLDGQAPIGGQLGLLNQFGAADAVLEIPANLDPAFVGITVSHAAVVANWFTPRLAVTNAIGATIAP